MRILKIICRQEAFEGSDAEGESAEKLELEKMNLNSLHSCKRTYKIIHLMETHAFLHTSMQYIF